MTGVFAGRVAACDATNPDAHIKQEVRLEQDMQLEGQALQEDEDPVTLR